MRSQASPFSLPTRLSYLRFGYTPLRKGIPYPIELLAGFNERGTFTQPFEFFRAGIGTGAANTPQKILNGFTDLTPIGDQNIPTFRGSIFL